jgi:hypothetical protein
MRNTVKLWSGTSKVHQRCREDGRIILKQILGTYNVKAW